MAFDAPYDNSEAQLCMTLAAIAYSSENVPGEIQATIIANLKQFLPDWELVWGPGLTSDNQNLIYLAQDTTQPARYAVCIRGTDICFLSNLQEDAGVNTQVALPFGPQDQGIAIDSGSLAGLNDLTTLTAQAVVNGVSIGDPGTLALYLENQVANVSSGDTCDVFVTGHSLGGCLASVAMPWLVETSTGWTNASALNVKAYTFAAPTAGNAAFASWVDSFAAPYFMWRVVNPRDLAPYAWGDLNSVIPLGQVVDVAPKLAILELIPAVSLIEADLEKHEVSYTQPSNAFTLANNLDFSASCGGARAATAQEFFCWVGNEHSGNTYLTLLGGTPTNITNDPNCPAFTPPGGGTDNSFAQAQIAAWKKNHPGETA
jgi:hypothetical protein